MSKKKQEVLPVAPVAIPKDLELPQTFEEWFAEEALNPCTKDSHRQCWYAAVNSCYADKTG